ncbi:NAD+ synthase [Modestobacter sp. VKM Ac-2979]|uniref:NAD+ synthase n=1 Tax=unclassified Modestobacter TaxID=2643866 RepID=UPI0022ABA4E3|nr:MULTISPECIES: NAD+ synthase [unclassified Modestobacter]MCZ2813074.1 NAD+ synthase [Modestobacter sp. VKM Ac-2979]MCZ2842897.1 NAD+ synthase [Modestobacter sp. VKM Ac-2980]
MSDQQRTAESARQLRVALAQVDTRVGDLAGNAELVVEWTRRAAGRDAHLVVFPEMTLTGYPAEDLVLRESFARASEQTLVELAGTLAEQGLGGTAVVVGYLAHTEGAGPAPVDEMPTDADDAPGDANPRRGAPRNAAALLHGGEVVARYHKRHLPNYGVFDEARYFVPGTELPIVRLHGVDVALTICEDLWVEGGPCGVAGQAGVDLVVSPNASPYERAKDDLRLPLVQRRAAEANAPIVYCNQVGGQDELVFDGDSLAVSAAGELLARAPQFVEHLLTVDLTVDPAAVPVRREGRIGPMTVTRHLVSEQPVAAYPAQPGTVAEPLSDCEEVWRALVLGLRDFIDKNGMPSVVLGMSGGIDSAVVAALAVDALGADRVVGVGLPSRWSSEHSLADAADSAERLGMHYSVVPIAPVVTAFEGAVELSGVAAENVQARVRGTLLMGLSNQHGHLLLATSNKSEVAVGYSTLYGDAAGGFAPIKDVPKTLVWDLARWRNAHARDRGQVEPIPQNSIDKPPSAELAPGQQDSDSLPSYEELDAVIADYVDRDLGLAQLLERGHDPEVVARVLRLVDLAEFKRRQSAPGTKISLKAFGRDRRLPITNRWRESLPSVREGAAR